MHMHGHTHACTHGQTHDNLCTHIHLDYTCMLSLIPVHHHICTHMFTHIHRITRAPTPGFWLLTALMQPKAEASVLTQPLVFSFLASYRGSTKLCLQQAMLFNPFLSLYFFPCSPFQLFPLTLITESTKPAKNTEKCPNYLQN